MAKREVRFTNMPITADVVVDESNEMQNYVPTRFDDAPGRTIAKREVRFTNMPITADVVVDESNENKRIKGVVKVLEGVNSAVKKTSVGPVAGEGTGKQKRYGLNKDDVLLYERENIIMTDAFLAARSPRAKRVSVRSDDYDYNFVIPKNLVIKLDAVVKAEEAKRRTPASFGGNAEDETTSRCAARLIELPWKMLTTRLWLSLYVTGTQPQCRWLIIPLRRAGCGSKGQSSLMDDGAVMRLRVMWMILMQPDESTTSNKVAKAVQSTDIELIATITT
ncbi:hypothetical protein PHYSODRAFT_329955 [Phytophthora sojae]|uniref:Uncharacterized protein n=1 Tax=Phytophthora sojae (strain P6497) TaxID=1094619 RepID=G4ZBZ6_PHYSP|nr:hypothetical protein PHYSODRAFT_329955 [Phytophthora sojae]EGZ22097.1 hypothetical protein PHYSODRAFT_329955 [Phytophthora sojae]|eukprot:XP_009524814.1 hypothetical protein PHYSODRAFT_329955 [Phytophthora sojae]